MSDEKATKNKLSKALKTAGLFYYNTHDTYMKGLPDTYVCGSDGRSIWIELKRLKAGETLTHPLTVHQSFFLKNINDSGGLGLMVVELQDGRWHWEEVVEIGEKRTSKWNPRSLDSLIESL